MRVEATDTHTGEWNLFGAVLPPAGKPTSIMMVFIWRIEDVFTSSAAVGTHLCPCDEIGRLPPRDI